MKRIMTVLCTLLLCIMVAGPVSVKAITPIDPEKAASLTLQYRYEETSFSGLDCSIYRVAEVAADGTFTLTGAFANYPVNIYGIGSQTEWRNIASTLSAYAAADQIQPDYTAQTDENGKVQFGNILPGMYLTLSVTGETDTKIVVFESFLTVLPMPSENEEHLYDVTAYPKAVSHTPTPEEKEYKVVKQWKDAGYTDERPESITVDIIKDGAVHSTQILSADNDWCYRWTAPDDGSQWQAVERNVSGAYSVTTVTDGTTIIITNAHPGEPEPPPTGDIWVLWPFLLLMIFAGGAVLVLAVWRMRCGE